MSITISLHAAASQPVRMALMDERLQQLLTEIDGSANAEKVGGRTHQQSAHVFRFFFVRCW